MGKRYRVIWKVYCDECFNKVQNKQWIDTRCKSCKFMRFANVPDLLSFTEHLDDKHPHWVYFNCYEYIKDAKGRLLGSYQNKGRRPISKNEL